MIILARSRMKFDDEEEEDEEEEEDNDDDDEEVVALVNRLIVYSRIRSILLSPMII